MAPYFSRGEKLTMFLAAIAIAVILFFTAKDHSRRLAFCHSNGLLYDSAEAVCVGVRGGNTVILPIK